MTYFMRTIGGFEEYIQPIDTLLEETFLPVIFDQEEGIGKVLRNTCHLPSRDGGLGIKILRNDSQFQYASSLTLAERHTEAINKQHH